MKPSAQHEIYATKIMGKLKICLVGSKKPYPAYDSLSSILKEVLGSEQVIELRVKGWIVKVPSLLKPLFMLLQDVILYLKILICRKRHKINAVLIYQGYYPLTCMGLSLLNLKVLLYIGGSAFRSSYYQKRSFMDIILAFSNIPISEICHKFSHLIILPSKHMINWLGLEKHVAKIQSAICIVGPKFFNNFTYNTKYTRREKILGYVGSLVESKGIMNFIQSISIIKSKHEFQTPNFLIIGDGPLFDYLKAKITDYRISGNVLMKRFVPHSILPYYYNSMKLLVLPSYTEGLPSVILEAMACGTPVLATLVGAIPYIIRDGEIGFFLKSNDPKHIAERIIELLDKPELLEKVSVKAYNYVRENFSYEKTLEAWRKILSELELSK